jgi:hypothetical protein
MRLKAEDGAEIDWAIELDRGTRDELARWRDFVEARLSMPAGTVTGFHWNDGGDVIVVVRRDKLLSPPGSN